MTQSSKLEVKPGRTSPRGATWDGVGVNFAVFSRVATRVEVGLFDGDRETARLELRPSTHHTWHGYVAGLGPGQRYALRVHGPWQPAQGHRCDASKWLLDPYAREVCGEHAVVIDPAFDWDGDHPLDIPWARTVIYELHVRGFSKLHPRVPAQLRGTYAGLAHPASIAHLKHLGVTAVELLPIHTFIDDGFLLERGLSNYWGYSPLAWLAPMRRYASRPERVVHEFKEMVQALHRAGIEVILDVVYNHTCEGSGQGPTLSLKGIDNASYYALDGEGGYRDVTGCGNSIDCSKEPAQHLILESLRYWVTEMHVDGFRFDLATTLGRDVHGHFDAHASLLAKIAGDPLLSRRKLIAEPWDLGEQGYRVGQFPAPMREWNDKFRDAVRCFWRGDPVDDEALAAQLRGAIARSIDFVTSHDGNTLRDLVSYAHKHNEANREHNLDGSNHEHGCNHGVEGPSTDPRIRRLRRRHVRNLLTSLLLGRGTPMLLAGDELGRTQRGNNNAYCQDNEVSWLDWRRSDQLDFTRRLLRFRARLEADTPTVVMVGAQGVRLHFERARVVVLYNASAQRLRFALPEGRWRLRMDSSGHHPQVVTSYTLAPRASAILVAK